jgi:hypothetical protein
LSFCDVIPFGDGPRDNHPVGLKPPNGMTPAEALMLHNCGGGCSTTMARRDKLIEVGGFHERLVSPDWLTWAKLSWITDVVWVGEPLVLYRNHAGNTSIKVQWNRSNQSIRWRLWLQCPPHLQHMRRRILSAARQIQLLRLYIIANRLSGGLGQPHQTQRAGVALMRNDADTIRRSKARIAELKAKPKPTFATPQHGEVRVVENPAMFFDRKLSHAFRNRLNRAGFHRLRYFCSPQHIDSALYPIVGQMEHAAGAGARRSSASAARQAPCPVCADLDLN